MRHSGLALAVVLAVAVLAASGCAAPIEVLSPRASVASAPEADVAQGGRLHRFQVISGRWGYMDSTGAVVLPAQYDAASVFQEGRASVRLEGRTAVIDPAGRIVVPPRYDAVDLFVGGRARVALGEGSDATYGFIDAAGEEVVPPVLLEATAFGDGLAVARVREPVTGWARQLATRLGVLRSPRRTVAIGPDGGVSYELDHRTVTAFSEGLAPFRDRTSRRWGYLATDGTVAIPPRFDGIAYGFTEGRARVADGGRIGYIDREGAFVVSPTFTSALPFAEGLAAVHDAGRWGYIDRDGTTVIAPRFTEAASFSEGLAAFRLGGRWGYIDTSGEVVIEPAYASASPFRNGLALVYQGGRAIVINRLGEPVSPRGL